MPGELAARLVPCGLFLFAACAAVALGRSEAEDPKLKLLDSLLRALDEDETDSRRPQAG